MANVIVAFKYFAALQLDLTEKKLLFHGEEAVLPLSHAAMQNIIEEVLSTGFAKSGPTSRAEARNALVKFLPRWVFNQDQKDPAAIRDVTLAVYPRDQRSKGPNNVTMWSTVRYTNFQEMLGKFFIEAYYSRGMRAMNWRNFCVAVSSLLNDEMGRHMPILDYAGRNPARTMARDVKGLQETFGLGPARIYRTRKGGHIYFPTDAVRWTDYRKIIEAAQCCPEFRDSAIRSDMATLRVSARYTDFDIEFLETIRPEGQEPRRPHALGMVAEHLIALGTECGTHLAALFPQWAVFREDAEPWKPRRAPARRSMGGEVSAAKAGGFFKASYGGPPKPPCGCGECQAKEEAAKEVAGMVKPQAIPALPQEVVDKLAALKKAIHAPQPPAAPYPTYKPTSHALPDTKDAYMAFKADYMAFKQAQQEKPELKAAPPEAPKAKAGVTNTQVVIKTAPTNTSTWFDSYDYYSPYGDE